MSQVIAFINFKGGVGKTANAVHVGTCLAADHNKRVLIVDLDPQCSATYWFLPPKDWRSRIDDVTRTVCQVFHDGTDGTKKFSFSNSIIKGVPISQSGIGLNPKLDLLPASVELIEVEDILHEQTKKTVLHLSTRRTGSTASGIRLYPSRLSAEHFHGHKERSFLRRFLRRPLHSRLSLAFRIQCFCEAVMQVSGISCCP